MNYSSLPGPADRTSTMVEALVTPPQPKPRSVGGGLLDPGQLWRSLPHAVRKLSPTTLWRNPVMLIVEVGAAFTTVLAAVDPSVFAWAITGWLWLTVVFANLAETGNASGTLLEFDRITGSVALNAVGAPDVVRNNAFLGTGGTDTLLSVTSQSGAVVEEKPRYREGVVVRRGVVEPCEGKVEQRLPVRMPRLPIFQGKRRALHARGSLGAALLPRGFGPGREDPSHLVQVAADDGGVDRLARDVGVLRQQAPRGSLRDDVRVPPADMVIGTGVREEPGDDVSGGQRICRRTRTPEGRRP